MKVAEQQCCSSASPETEFVMLVRLTVSKEIARKTLRFQPLWDTVPIAESEHII